MPNLNKRKRAQHRIYIFHWGRLFQRAHQGTRPRRQHTHQTAHTHTIGIRASVFVCDPNNAVLVYAIINSCEPRARPRQCVHAVRLLFVGNMRLRVIAGLKFDKYVHMLVFGNNTLVNGLVNLWKSLWDKYRKHRQHVQPIEQPNCFLYKLNK